MDSKLVDAIIDAYKKGRADAQVDNLKEKLLAHGPVSPGCEFCNQKTYTSSPFTVTTQMGREVQCVFNYCPNCGRRMKGADLCKAKNGVNTFLAGNGCGAGFVGRRNFGNFKWG